jgi:hypothetical protein
MYAGNTHAKEGWEMLNTQDVEQLSGQISQNARELSRAWDFFDGAVEHWRNLADHFYEGSLKIEPSAGRSALIRGTIASKSFAAHAYPIVMSERLFIEVLVTAEFPELGLRAEALRFLISSSGDFYQPDGTKAIDALGEKPSYTVLVNLLTHVLKTPAPALSDKTFNR